MKSFYNKLKECENYNPAILLILSLLTIKLVGSLITAGFCVWQMIEWNLLGAEGFEVNVPLVIDFIFTALAVVFIIHAVMRDIKFIFCGIASLAVAAVCGASLCALLCLVICAYWFWMVKFAKDKPCRYHVMRIALLLAIAVMLFVLILYVSMGHFAEWGPVE